MTDKKPNIPQFASREEAAAFWDTHSFADFWETGKPIQVRYEKRFTEPLNLKIQADDLIAMKRLAARKGIGVSSLARMWIKVMLQKEKLAGQ